MGEGAEQSWTGTTEEWIAKTRADDEANRTINGYRHGDWHSQGYMSCSHSGCTKKAWPSEIYTDHDCCGKAWHHR